MLKNIPKETTWGYYFEQKRKIREERRKADKERFEREQKKLIEELDKIYKK
jgi:hypothetical protein